MRRNIHRRKKRAYVLRHRRRSILCSSADKPYTTNSYDKAIPGGRSAEDGERLAKIFLQEKDEDTKLRTLVTCPLDAIPASFLKEAEALLHALDRRLLLVGRTVCYNDPARSKNISYYSLCLFVLSLKINTGEIDSGYIQWPRLFDRTIGTPTYMDIPTDERVSTVIHKLATAQFYTQYYNLFKMTYPEYRGIITAPGYMLESYKSIDPELCKQKRLISVK